MRFELYICTQNGKTHCALRHLHILEAKATDAYKYQNNIYTCNVNCIIAIDRREQSKYRSMEGNLL